MVHIRPVTLATNGAYASVVGRAAGPVGVEPARAAEALASVPFSCASAAPAEFGSSGVPAPRDRGVLQGRYRLLIQ